MPDNPDDRLLLLKENILFHTLPMELQEYHKNMSQLKIKKFDLKIDYNYLSVEDVLKKILPKEITEIPSSFECIGI